MSSLVSLTPDIFHIGDVSTHEGLDCHPYLLIDQNEAVLFDPGSPYDIEVVLENIERLIPLSQVKYVVLHHEDPDFCSGVPYLESKGLKAQIITSWRTMTLLQYYQIQSPYYLLEEHRNELTLESGRTLEFIMTPYLHFAGAFMTYDKKTRTLFSSDLFGAFSYNKTLYADDQYIEKMKTFHEHYMPGNAILRPVMDLLLNYPLDRILPQHGSLIIADPRKYILELRELQCGLLLTPVKKNLLASGGFLNIFNELLTRFNAIYDPEEVFAVFKDVEGLVFDDSLHIVNLTQDGQLIWDMIFAKIEDRQGLLWLAVIEPYVKSLSMAYDIPVPDIFNAMLRSAHETSSELMIQNQALDQTMKMVQEKLIRCPITGLYNDYFFKNLIIEELEKEDWRDLGLLIMINIDDSIAFKLKYGEIESKIVLNNLAYLFKNTFGESSVFKMDLSDFGLYVKTNNPEEIIALADQVRIQISKSDLFIEPITVSMGIAFPSEIPVDAPTFESALEHYLETGYQRLHHATKLGKNIICHTGNFNKTALENYTILVADPDTTHLEVLKVFFTELGIEVYTATDGQEAKQIAEMIMPQLIISDVMLPKIDGFLLREQLLQQSDTKGIEFIFISHQKDNISVTRAMNLGVIHYLKKPYLLSELIGITNKKRKGVNG